MQDKSETGSHGSGASGRTVALSIAGSDSCGGAGIQRDLAAFADIGIQGRSAITCITAQTPGAVLSIHPLPPDVVAAQIAAVLHSGNVKAVKTGMLYNAEIIEAVADKLRGTMVGPLVVDPVMVSSSGTVLLEKTALAPFCELLLPLSSVITPNTPEAEELSGMTVKTVDSMKKAAQEIGRRFKASCVVTGGHIDSGNVVHCALFTSSASHFFSFERVEAPDTHGTGCAFSAALTALLAMGNPLSRAVQGAGEYMSRNLAKQTGRDLSHS